MSCGAFCVGELVGDAEGFDALFVGKEVDGAGPVGAPHASVEAVGAENLG